MANLRVGTGITFDGATGNFNALGIGTVRGAINATSGLNVGSAVTISSNGNIGISGICTAGGGIHVGAAGTVSGLSRRTISSSTTLTSQSSVDYTGFGVITRFEIHLNAVSCNSAAEFGVRLGTGGSVDTSGYLCQSAYVRSSDNVGEHQTSGFFAHGLAGASYSSNGVIRCWRVDGITQHKWYLLADIYEYSSDNHWYYMKGYRTLSGELDIIRVLPQSGTFDSGNLRLVTFTD